MGKSSAMRFMETLETFQHQGVNPQRFRFLAWKTIGTSGTVHSTGGAHLPKKTGEPFGGRGLTLSFEQMKEAEENRSLCLSCSGHYRLAHETEAAQALASDDGRAALGLTSKEIINTLKGLEGLFLLDFADVKTEDFKSVVTLAEHWKTLYSFKSNLEKAESSLLFEGYSERVRNFYQEKTEELKKLLLTPGRKRVLERRILEECLPQERVIESVIHTETGSLISQEAERRRKKLIEMFLDNPVNVIGDYGPKVRLTGSRDELRAMVAGLLIADGKFNVLSYPLHLLVKAGMDYYYATDEYFLMIDEEVPAETLEAYEVFVKDSKGSGLPLSELYFAAKNI